MGSLVVHFAVEWRKSNIKFDAVGLPFRQILTKYSKIEQTYKVLCEKTGQPVIDPNGSFTFLVIAAKTFSCHYVLTFNIT